MEKQQNYYVMPYDELESSSYPTLELIEWLAQPHKSFKKACQIADDLAKKATYNGRIVDHYVVVKESHDYPYGHGIDFFQKKYEVIYKATCNEPYPHNITAVWESRTNEEMVIKHGQSYFDQYFDWVQDMRKSWDGYNIAWFADCLSAARFLKKEWANANELILTVQKNGQRINLSNQFFRFGNVLSAQCVANWLGNNNPTYYNWYVGEQIFPSYGDAVIHVLESKELNFDDITRTKKEDVAE